MASGAPGMPGTLFTPDGAPFAFAPPAGTAVIRAIFVHPRWSRRGLGRRVMQVAELGAASSGCPSAELVATLSGVPLYRALGYAAGAELNVALCEDVRMPVVHMCKRLCEQAPAVAA
jgi:GNAT superfamily N-acetyltransferase